MFVFCCVLPASNKSRDDDDDDDCNTLTVPLHVWSSTGCVLLCIR